MTLHGFALSDWSVRRKVTLALFIVAATVFVAYYSALNLSFVGDDWIFYDLAGRLSLRDYLIKYFDPRVQTAWYRPVQGIVFRIAYDIFGANLWPYHLLNILIHLMNCFLLFAVVGQVIRRWYVGFVAALLYASFPTAVEGVFKPGVIDPPETTFFLLTVWLWLRYLVKLRSRDYWFAFGSFVLALLSKEIAITLPITLWLIERFVVPASRVAGREWMRRYFWFGLAWIAYFPIAFIVTRRSVFVNQEGYQASAHLLSNLADYLGSLAFPWAFSPTISYIWLLVVAAALAYIIFAKRLYALIPVIASAVFAILPILPFPFVTNRFLYQSLTASALVFALAFDLAWQRLPRQRIYRVLAMATIASVTALGSLGVANAAADLGEFSRVTRVPFRNVSQAHPTFPEDTLIYFINAPVPGPTLSGMFFWRYGARVTVGADDMGARAGLRDHQNAYVYYFDKQGNQKEVRVEKETALRAAPALPATFAEPIRLEGFDLTNANAKRGNAIVLILYWRATGKIDKDYTVFLHLVDAATSRIWAGYDDQPRGGDAPTSTWGPNSLVVDAKVFPIPVDIPVGNNYQLEVGLYHQRSGQRLTILDLNEQPIRDNVVVGPIQVVE